MPPSLHKIAAAVPDSGPPAQRPAVGGLRFRLGWLWSYCRNRFHRILYGENLKTGEFTVFISYRHVEQIGVSPNGCMVPSRLFPSPEHCVRRAAVRGWGGYSAMRKSCPRVAIFQRRSNRL